MPQPVRKFFSPNLTRIPPQPLVRYAEICDTCKGVDTFRALCKIRGVLYVKCQKCGRHGTRTTVVKPANKSY